jgi:CRP-like cAMP-binding protein
MTTATALEVQPTRSAHDDILACANSTTWQPGQVIFREGHRPTGVWIVLSGHVDLVFAAKHGNAKPLRAARPGEILALSEAISGAEHHATAVAESSCEIGFVPIAELRRLLDENPATWFAVLRMLSLELNQSWDSLRAAHSSM